MLKGYLEDNPTPRIRRETGIPVQANIMKAKGIIFEFLLIPFFCPKGQYHQALGRTQKDVLEDLKLKINEFGYGKPISDPKVVEKHTPFWWRISKLGTENILVPRTLGGKIHSLDGIYNPHAVIYDDPNFISGIYNPHAVIYDDPNFISGFIK